LAPPRVGSSHSTEPTSRIAAEEVRIFGATRLR